MLDALGTITAIMSSSGVGAIVGGVFGWLNRREDRKARQADQQHERDMVGLRANADQQTSEARAFEESQKGWGAFGDAIRSIVRPIITGVLLFMVYDIHAKLDAVTGGIEALPAAEAAELYRQIVLNIICLASTAVGWWFASRPSGIPPLRIGAGT